MMRTLVVSLGIAAVALVSGCYENTDKETGATGPLYRHHFAGMTQILKGTNATKLKDVWGLKSTADLRQHFLDKLAVTPREFWRKQLPPTATDQKELIRPLLDDLVTSESYLEIKGPTTRAEGVLAIRLTPERLTLWNNNLGKLASTWNIGTQEPAQAGNSKGWAIKRKQDAGILQVMQAGEWMLVGIGQEKLTLLPNLIDQTTKASRPVPAMAQANLLSLDTDLPRLKKWFPFIANAKMPPIHTDLVGEGEYIRTKSSLRFSEKIPWKPEAWKIPTNVINEPLCGFTVGQGIAPILPDLKGVSRLGLKTYPNQFCIWSEDTTHFVTFMSAPVPNASNVLRQIGPKLPAFLKDYFPEMSGQVGMASNRSEVIWSGLPVVVPFLRTTNIAGTDYMVGGVLPIFKRTNSPPPADLFRQFMGRNDLMYYDWEITQQSLIHSRQFWQLMDIVGRRSFPRTNAPSMAWITEVAPRLGNTITEVTRTAPNELSLTRKSHLGLTGSEMVLFLRWLDSSAFPFGYEPPPKIGANRDRSRARTNLQNKATSAPIPQPNLPAPKPNLPATKPK